MFNFSQDVNDFESGLLELFAKEGTTLFRELKVLDGRITFSLQDVLDAGDSGLILEFCMDNLGGEDGVVFFVFPSGKARVLFEEAVNLRMFEAVRAEARPIRNEENEKIRELRHVEALKSHEMQRKERATAHFLNACGASLFALMDRYGTVIVPVEKEADWQVRGPLSPDGDEATLYFQCSCGRMEFMTELSTMVFQHAPSAEISEAATSDINDNPFA